MNKTILHFSILLFALIKNCVTTFKAGRPLKYNLFILTSFLERKDLNTKISDHLEPELVLNVIIKYCHFSSGAQSAHAFEPTTVGNVASSLEPDRGEVSVPRLQSLFQEL